MAVYCPALGSAPDGRCACGNEATNEMQVGWHSGRNGESGGQYQELCADCYEAEIQDFYDVNPNKFR